MCVECGCEVPSAPDKEPDERPEQGGAEPYAA
jgi:hypothetical protein